MTMTASHQTVPGTRAAELATLLQVAGQEVFRLMMGTELGHSSEVAWSGVKYTAMVGLAGELCGVLSVRCSEEASRQVAALMLDLPPEKAAEHAWDALGEVANMVAGSFKTKV